MLVPLANLYSLPVDPFISPSLESLHHALFSRDSVVPLFHFVSRFR